jgi:glycosyltransferase involved in cell wall biosynthesis
VAFITRSTLYDVFGGSGLQVTETANQLVKSGISVDIYLTHQEIDYSKYDLLHFFDLTRPANILPHIHSGKPFVISPILVDFSEFDKYHRKGFGGMLFKFISPDKIEYIKTVARWLLKKDSLRSKSYLWRGQRRSIRFILKKTALLLPNSEAEYKKLSSSYKINRPYTIVPNGVNTEFFSSFGIIRKREDLIICAARIEGIKNQLNLIKALNNTAYSLLLIGEPSPNQQSYYKECKKQAASNIHFLGKLSQEELATYYQQAKVHVLPSWFETCGLSSLEAAFMGCNLVITDRGFTRDYFGNDAFYCEPGDPASIFEAIDRAAKASQNNNLRQKIMKEFTWEIAATKTLEGYRKALNFKDQ